MGCYGMNLTEKTLERETLFQGRIVTLWVDQAELPNGRTTVREVVGHPGGVCVLPLEEDGTVYTVKQWRYPFARVVEELPAGKLDGPEEHRAGAIRELSEEVGVEAGELIYLGSLLMSPGFCDEVLHMYLARDLRHGQQHPDEDEFLDVVRTPFPALVERVMKGELSDAKTVALILKAREFLRREAGGTV